MRNDNPFNITFGKEPSSIISRREELSEIYDTFSSFNPKTQVYVLTGVRGSGKTVAMTTIGDYFKEKNNWLKIELNVESGMLEQLASKLFDEGKIKKHFLKAEFSFSFQGVSFSIKGDTPITSVSTLLKKEFEYLKKKGIRVLVCIDEAVSNNHMKVFAHEFQSLIREGYGVFLLMAGLYQNISSLESNRSLTFLLRAPKVHLSSLNLMAISHSYETALSASREEAIELAKFTKGYAFAYQLVGDILFEEGRKKLTEDDIRKFDELIYERTYSFIYKECSELERKIIKLASYDDDNESIKAAASISSASLSNYKRVLAKKGIVSIDRDRLLFALPRFKEITNFIAKIEE